MKSKKILLCALLALVVLAGAVCLVVCLREEEPQKLSALSAEELYTFFYDRGITFPKGIPSDINAFVAYIEEHPDGDFKGTEVINWTTIRDVLDAARDAVNEYYGIDIKE